jgi:multicomponent Na+:H+ antiporter subunit B
MTGRETTVIARTVTRVVVPLIFLTAISLLIQGHNKPGGGFIAGVLTATAFALISIIFGLDYVREELLGQPAASADHVERVFGLDRRGLYTSGLSLAAAGGLAAIFFDLAFLSQGVVLIKDVPIFHEFELASALVFDLGVYAVVVGALLSILGVVGAE